MESAILAFLVATYTLAEGICMIVNHRMINSGASFNLKYTDASVIQFMNLGGISMSVAGLGCILLGVLRMFALKGIILWVVASVAILGVLAFGASYFTLRKRVSVQ